MSKRYGRKQKAKARAKIAELTARLGRESTAHMYLPGDVPDLESLARVVRYRVTEDGGVGQMIERSATVTIEAIAGMYELVKDQQVVQFKGSRYIVVNGSYDAHYRLATMGGPSHAELELVGVAS